MCGIAGHVGRHPIDGDDAITAQLAQLAHRGPDSRGWFASGRGVVGQTRLAIIDLVTGDPPISDESRQIGVALNGEIYNYRELRAQVIADGHTMRTTGDTEVIAHLAEDLSPVELGQALDGMFGVAVWDERHERLALIRDRFGKKPLYWWQGPDAFVFGSEIKAVLAHPAVTAELNPLAIPAYLGFGYMPSPHTFYAGIESVPSGHVLVLDRDMNARTERYWSPSVPGVDGTTALDLSVDEAARELRTRISTAVRKRLVADVPLGAYLSGGIDSSVIVASMSEALTQPVRTFTIGFEDDQGFDERPYAQAVAERFGTEHTEFVVAPDAVDLVERLVWHHDQPFGDSSAVPSYLLAQLTRGSVTVALSGDGGDELFAGYERFTGGAALGAITRLPHGLVGGARAVLARSARPGSLLEKAQRFAASADAGLPDAYRAWVAFIDDATVDRLTPGATWARDQYRCLWERTAGAATLDRLLLLNLSTYLPDDLLVKADRTSMAHALEVRSPFLDHELAEFALRLPVRTKAFGTNRKRALKRAFADVLPGEILNRPKRGFGVPLDRWFRKDLAGFVDGTLGASDARVRHHLAGAPLDGLLAEHRVGRRNHGHALWTLLTLEVFLRKQGW